MEQHPRGKFTLSFCYLEADIPLRPNESALSSQTPTFLPITFHFEFSSGTPDTSQDFNHSWALCHFTAIRVCIELFMWLKSLVTTEHPMTILLQSPWYSGLSFFSLLRLNSAVICIQTRTLVVTQWTLLQIQV